MRPFDLENFSQTALRCCVIPSQKIRKTLILLAKPRLWTTCEQEPVNCPSQHRGAALQAGAVNALPVAKSLRDVFPR